MRSFMMRRHEGHLIMMDDERHNTRMHKFGGLACEAFYGLCALVILCVWVFLLTLCALGDLEATSPS